MWPKITWNQPGGLTECPYFHRTVIDFGKFAIRFHHWHADDDHRAFHDHPYWLFIIVLRGGYTDVSPEGKDVLTRGSIRYRPADYKHSVQNVIPGTLTLVITGKPFRRWGFWIDGKLIKRDRYFVEQGHHPCDPTQPAIRQKPDGTRI